MCYLRALETAGIPLRLSILQRAASLGSAKKSAQTGGTSHISSLIIELTWIPRTVREKVNSEVSLGDFIASREPFNRSFRFQHR